MDHLSDGGVRHNMAHRAKAFWDCTGFITGHLGNELEAERDSESFGEERVQSKRKVRSRTMPLVLSLCECSVLMSAICVDDPVCTLYVHNNDNCNYYTLIWLYMCSVWVPTRNTFSASLLVGTGCRELQQPCPLHAVGPSNSFNKEYQLNEAVHRRYEASYCLLFELLVFGKMVC